MAPSTDRTLRADGFDPASGSFLVAAEKNRVRITLDGRGRPTYSPAFQISGGKGGQSWVYVDNLIFEPVTRLGRGDVLFQLPGTVRKKVLIETLYRHDGQSSPP